MPTRSSTSSVLVWPDAATVRGAVATWAAELARERPEVVAIGYFGSYARGDWGVGSDLDLVIVVDESTGEARLRAADIPYEKLPVPADVLVFTAGDFDRISRAETRFGAAMQDEVAWVFERRPRVRTIGG